MEARWDHENPVQWMPLTFGGSSQVPGDDPKQHFAVGAERITDHLPIWMHFPRASPVHVNFLSGNSTFVREVPIQQDNSAPTSVFHAGNGIFRNQTGMQDKSMELADALNSARAPLDMNALKEMYLSLHDVELVNKHDLRQISAKKNLICRTRKPCKDMGAASQTHSRARIVSRPSPRQRDAASRQKATAADRLRRLRIAEGLGALQKLLPNSEETVLVGERIKVQASTLDDVIDHIKLLQHQIKELSRSRLGGEQNSEQLFFLEGYGHYFLREHVLNEPLEEVMGKMLERNPSAVFQLLQSRGLALLPVVLAEGFQSK